MNNSDLVEETLEHDSHANPRKISDKLTINNIFAFIIGMLALVFFVKMANGQLPGLYDALKDFTTSNPYYPVWIIVLPMIQAAITSFMSIATKGGAEDFREGLATNVTLVTLLMILAFYPQVVEGPVVLEFSKIFGVGLFLRIDMFSLTMLTISSLVWFFTMIYAPNYMMFEDNRNRFYIFLAITYGAIIGTLMGGDALTVFFFFEIMTVASSLLVVHSQTDDAMAAGDLYTFIGVMGGLAILSGMILLYANTGSLEFGPRVSALVELGNIRYLIVALFIVGFGVKAGMVPLHIWLPKAHPVAPTPASALLSGIMIKVGAYGILRVLTSFTFPRADEIIDATHALWATSHNVGAVIIWMGITTMGIGVFMALQQGNMKRMLAFHSVSQIGYVIMGIGVATYLGYEGAMGFTGAIYHTINHALFKALLFMIAGAVYLQTHSLDMYKFGGFWKKMPLCALFCLIAAFGITGMPTFNGFASKTMLHHAIVEAYEHGSPVFRHAETAFNIISAGTACSFIKFFGFIFVGKLPEEYKDIKGGYKMMNLAMAGLAIVIVFVGQNPNFVLDTFLIPAARTMTYDPHFIDHHLVGINFFNKADMGGMIPVYIQGAIIFVVGIKFHLFHLHFPTWFRFDYIMLLPFYIVTDIGYNILSKGNKDENYNDYFLMQRIKMTLQLMAEAYDRTFTRVENFILGRVMNISRFTDKYDLKMAQMESMVTRADASAENMVDKYDIGMDKLEGSITGAETGESSDHDSHGPKKKFGKEYEDKMYAGEDKVLNFIESIKKFVGKYEMDIIKKDTVIYAMVLTGILTILILFR